MNKLLTTNELENYLKNLNIDKIADSIISHIEKKDTKIDYNFNFSSKDGKMKEDNNANTYIFFDADEESEIKKYIVNIFSCDLDIIDEHKYSLYKNIIPDLSVDSEEEISEKNRLLDAIDNTNILISDIIIKKYKSNLRNILRNKIFPSSDSTSIPMKDIDILELETIDLTGLGIGSTNIFKFKKNILVDKDGNVLENAEIDKENIIIDLEDYSIENSISVKEAFKRRKEENNILYKNIEDLEIEKNMYEVSIYMKVDYSYDIEGIIESLK
jgi:hypothetical protein